MKVAFNPIHVSPLGSVTPPDVCVSDASISKSKVALHQQKKEKDSKDRFLEHKIPPYHPNIHITPCIRIRLAS
jgi:hypothetical protein